MNFAFYVSRKATRLKKILEEGRREFLKDIKIVFSDDSNTVYLKDELSKYNIEYILFDYKNIVIEKGERKNLILSNKMLEIFKEYRIDYCFCFGSHILEGELLKVYENKIINFHPSILPSFRGRKAIDQAIESGAQVLGNTAHFIDDGVDTGLIIMQNIVSRSIFEKYGYDGVLDKQIPMVYSIYKALKLNKIKIYNRNVIIEEANYNISQYFPNVDFK